MKFGIGHYYIEIGEDDIKAFLYTIKEIFLRLSVPKNKKNKIGIIIALQTENDAEKNRIKNDFVAEMNSHLNSEELYNKFNLIIFPDYLSDKIKNIEDSHKYLVRSRSHFLLYGTLLKRNINENESYVFRLHGAVRHKVVSNEIKNKFTKEFIEILPKRISFNESQEVLGFELTQQWVSHIIKYIVGIASMISGDILLSYSLFNKLDKELVQQKNNIPFIDLLKKRLPIRLAETLILILQAHYFLFTRDRDKKHILDTKKYLDHLLTIDPNNYQGLLIKSIYLFFNDKIDNAIQLFENCNIPDPTWRYNIGFLYAYKGDIENALNHYQKTLYKEVSGNVICDTEVFITEAIETSPDKIQLYFFRGLINHKHKGDYDLAKKDFEFFLQNSNKTKYPGLYELAKKYLSEIKTNTG